MIQPPIQVFRSQKQEYSYKFKASFLYFVSPRPARAIYQNVMYNKTKNLFVVLNVLLYQYFWEHNWVTRVHVSVLVLSNVFSNNICLTAIDIFTYWAQIMCSKARSCQIKCSSSYTESVHDDLAMKFNLNAELLAFFYILYSNILQWVLLKDG